MNAACAVCHTTTEPLTASGLCGTCQSQASETKAAPPDEFAPTATGEPALDTLSAATTDTSDSLLPPGGYELIEEIGVGGMGLVWKARRLSTGQFVAIKKLQPKCFTPTGFKRFVAEARAIESVDHLNVVRLLDFVPDPADPFLVLEYVPGKNLVDLLKESGPFHPDRAARVLVDICHGVQAAHDKGIVHRDLKPNNVLLTPNGRVKVTDFGLTKSVAEAGVLVAAGGGADDSPEHADTLTRTGHTAGGTPGYLAPEQADATFAPIDRRADVWGVGATLFTLIVGRPPFAGGKVNMARVLTDPLVPPHDIDPRVPRDLSEIVVRCLQKQPADRYPSAAAVADDLTKFLNRDSTAARPQPWVQRQWRRAQGLNRGWWVAAGVLLLAVATGVGLAMVPKPPPVGVAALPAAPTPQEIQDEYRAELKAGRPVTLIGPTGLPRHHLWRLGSSTLVESWHGDETCTFEAVGPTLLELLDDPGIDRYIVRAEVRYLNGPGAQPAGGHVGLYVGFAHTPNGRGESAITILRLTYSDYDPEFIRTGELQPQVARSAAAVCFTGPARPRMFPMTAHAAPLYVPAKQRPGPWRVVEYEIDGRNLTPRWQSQKTGKMVDMAPRVLDAAGEYAVTQQKVDEEWPNAGVRVPAWNPRTPLGVFCDSAAVSVRKLVIVPLPPPRVNP
jgi:serine/threonine-protein kinase